MRQGGPDHQTGQHFYDPGQAGRDCDGVGGVHALLLYFRQDNILVKPTYIVYINFRLLLEWEER